jgi:hypothetical protein
MCTVSIVALDAGVRLVCNREEGRTRLEALPPTLLSTAAGSASYPVDPVSRGTWVGATDRGRTTVDLFDGGIHLEYERIAAAAAA